MLLTFPRIYWFWWTCTMFNADVLSFRHTRYPLALPNIAMKFPWQGHTKPSGLRLWAMCDSLGMLLWLSLGTKLTWSGLENDWRCWGMQIMKLKWMVLPYTYFKLFFVSALCQARHEGLWHNTSIWRATKGLTLERLTPSKMIRIQLYPN